MTPDLSVNIATPLAEMARLHPENAAIIFPEQSRTLTFRELDLWSSRLAAGFVQAGIGLGVRAALLVPPSPELFAITFALFKCGAIPVFIDPGIGAKNMKGCLAEAAPTAFIGIPKAHLARRLLGWGKASLKTLVSVNGSSFWGGVTLAEIEKDSTEFTPAATTASDTAAILFTSGSTGPPKGVIYSHGNFAAQIAALKAVYDIKPGEIDLPTFPLFALFAPALGMTAVIPQMDFTRPGMVDPAMIIRTAQTYQATTMFGSPALLNRVGRYGEEKEITLPCMKRVISAGAPVPSHVLERFSRMLPPEGRIFTPYGATEALPVCSIDHLEITGGTAAETCRGKGICVGRPVDGVSLAIIKISDQPIGSWSSELLQPVGEIGEIVVQGPQATVGYFNRPDADRLAKITAADGDFWHRMGDLGYLDAQGRVWFCGRKSHRVITPQGTLYTILVEGVFNSHPEVFRTALVGIGAPGRQRPVICVELEQGVSSSWREQIRKELLEIGAEYPHTAGIKDILFHKAFPVDIRHNAKIFREKLAVWAAGRVK
jgi:acyl-CoA synthetase (AMP-forming)/AMP-acid ligase II